MNPCGYTKISISEDINSEMYKRILSSWKQIDIDSFWGDALDVRFFLASFLKNKPFDILLDISCNCGIILNECSAHLRIGLDYSLNSLRKSQIHFPAIRNLQASSEFLPFREKSIDAVILAHSLPGWDYPIGSYKNKDKDSASARLFKDIYRVLKPRGKLYLTTVNGSHFYYNPKTKPASEDIIRYAQGLFNIDDVLGWNPLPVLGNIIPPSLTGKMPFNIRRLLFFPSTRMYSFIPGIWKMLIALSRIKKVNKRCRHLFYICSKLST